MLRVLFVCSGPVMYKTRYYYDFYGIEGMKKELPEDIFNYVIDNNLIIYMEEDEDQEFPTIYRKDLPYEYVKQIEEYEIEYRDLDKYREFAITTLKKLYPNVNTINYISVDPITLDPKEYGDDTIMGLIDKEDNKYISKHGVKMNFIDHYTMKFQDFINYYQGDKFDVIWFMQCTNFSLVIDQNEDYIENFRKTLVNDGLIIHFDWGGERKYDINSNVDQPVGKLIDIKERYNMLPGKYDINDDKIDWILSKLDQVDPGIYKLKPISKQQLLTMLLL